MKEPTSFAIGQRAAVYQSHYSYGGVTPVTVERDTKLYWVADGRKFRKTDGMEQGSGKGWDRGRYLLHVDDPRVVETQEVEGRRSAFGKVASTYNQLTKDRENLGAVQDLQTALNAYAEVLQ